MVDPLGFSDDLRLSPTTKQNQKTFECAFEQFTGCLMQLAIGSVKPRQ